MLQTDRDRVYIEYCTGCGRHQWCTNHKEEKYLKYFNDCKVQIMKANSSVVVAGNEIPPWLVKVYATDEGRPFGKRFFPRTGAFEVHFNRLVVFSKLETGRWPNPGLIGSRVYEMIKAARMPPPEKLKRLRTYENTAPKNKRKKRRKKLKKARSSAARTKSIGKRTPDRFFESNADKQLSATRTAENPRELFEAESSHDKLEPVAKSAYTTNSFGHKQDFQSISGLVDSFNKNQEVSIIKPSKDSSTSSGRKFKFPEEDSREEEGADFRFKSFLDDEEEGYNDDYKSEDPSGHISKSNERFSESKKTSHESEEFKDERYQSDYEVSRKALSQKIEDSYDDEYEESDQNSEAYDSSSSDDSYQITKSFGLTLPVGEICNKKITYQNKSNEPCEFILTSTKPNLMVPKDKVVNIQAGEKGKFQLRFAAVDKPCHKNLILKVESNGQLWEAIEIKATYE